LELYLNPVESWRQTLKEGQKGFNFIVLHLIYYSMLILIIFQDWNRVIQFVLLEVVITIFPFLFFLLPFFIFNRICALGISWHAFFRLLLIFKLQVIPLIVLLVTFYNWSGLEESFQFINDILWLIWIGMLVLLPLLIRIKWWQRFMWICANY